ncbi:hypothetical protein TREES_T100012573 [Tupaia chinensis]|uniref:Protein FAM240C n=1 Tax=Tupaia chinensis TaxID=246437 RepID=L8Y7M5_TUPCH|nr:hypothetical protein TREES_T100012573 [Tupaia chinensis]
MSEGTWKHPQRVAYEASRARTLWEEKIERHMKQLQSEDSRLRRSALSRLRAEWAQRLQQRNEMLQNLQEVPRRPARLPLEALALRTEDKRAA